MPFRLAVYAPDRMRLANGLTEFENGKTGSGWLCRQRNKDYKKQAAVFSGMGNQTESMGKDLYRNFPVFREQFCRCSREYEKYSDRSLKKAMESGTAPDYFYRVSFLQSYHLAYQISLFALLVSEGVEFCGCVGHSAGELAAFYCSGLLTLEETFRIAWHRGRCQERLQGKGKMLAVRMSRKEADFLCEKSGGLVSLGVENGENRMVLSGDLAELEEIEKRRGGKFLKGSVAYHSWQMDEVEKEFRRSVREPERGAAAHEAGAGGKTAAGIAAGMALYSTVYGDRMEENAYEVSYWWNNIRNTVEFAKTLKAMKRDGFDSFMEIGVTPVLMPSIAEEFYDRDFSCIAVQSEKEAGTETEIFCRAMMQVYVNRVPANFRAGGNKCGNLSLPGYRWDKKKLPVEMPDQEWEKPDPFLGRKEGLPLDIWKNRINLASHDWLKGHKAEGECYLPGVFYAAMLGRAGIREWKNMEILRPVILHPFRDTVLSFVPYPSGKAEVSVFSAAEGKWMPVMRAEASEGEKWKTDDRSPKNEEREWLEISGDAAYEILQRKSLHYSGSFRRIEKAWIGEDEIFCQLTAENGRLKKEALAGTLDAMLQAAALAGSRDIAFDRKYMVLPVGMEKARLSYREEKEYAGLYVHAAIREREEPVWKADCRLYDESGSLLAEFHQVSFEKKEKAETEEINTYRFQWEEIKRKEESKGKATVFLAGQDIETDIFRLLALIRNYRRKERRMVIVTENAVKVLPGDEVKGYRQAGLWGLVRCIRAERPDLEICLLDMDERGRIGDNGKYFSDGQDFSYVPEGEWEAAYRNGTLYGLRAVPVKERKDGRERHMQGITAVLTGASGGLAFPYALWMAAAGAERIALVSRQRSKRLEILLEALDYYRLQGKYIRADVTDRKQIERGLEQLEEEGWFEGKEKIFCHLAGYSEDCPYEEITPSILKKHLEPKMKGAENLSGLAQRWESQLVLIGSITAVLGNPGQGCYGAANSMLQSFAEYGGYRLEGFGALDTGMAVREKRVSHALQMQGIGIMESYNAVRCRKECGAEIGYTAKLDWRKVMDYRNMQKDNKFQFVRAEEESGDILGETYGEGNREEKEKILQKLLQTIFAEVLGMEEDEVSLDRNTDTMGIDSLSAAFIAGKIRQKTGSSMTPAMAAGAFTLRDMAMGIVQERESAESGERS